MSSSDLIKRIKSSTAFTTPDEIVKELEAQQAEIAQLKSQYSDVNEQLFSASLAYENEHIEKSDRETEIALLREALEYMLRAWDREVGKEEDILLMVTSGAKVFSVASARAVLEQKP